MEHGTHIRHPRYIPPTDVLIEIFLISKELGHVCHRTGVPLFNAAILCSCLIGDLLPQMNSSSDALIGEERRLFDSCGLAEGVHDVSGGKKGRDVRSNKTASEEKQKTEFYCIYIL